MEILADLAVAALTQTIAREAVVDFTIPLFGDTATLIAPVSTSQSTQVRMN